jgi:hypothetical protein
MRPAGFSNFFAGRNKSGGVANIIAESPAKGLAELGGFGKIVPEHGNHALI